MLVKALKSQEYDLAPGGVLFREAKFIMAIMFNSTSITQVYRSCNIVDHDLARFGRDRDLDHPPNFCKQSWSVNPRLVK